MKNILEIDDFITIKVILKFFKKDTNNIKIIRKCKSFQRDKQFCINCIILVMLKQFVVVFLLISLCLNRMSLQYLLRY